jgi:hypothetical protein
MRPNAAVRRGTELGPLCSPVSRPFIFRHALVGDQRGEVGRLVAQPADHPASRAAFTSAKASSSDLLPSRTAMANSCEKCRTWRAVETLLVSDKVLAEPGRFLDTSAMKSLTGKSRVSNFGSTPVAAVDREGLLRLARSGRH